MKKSIIVMILFIITLTSISAAAEGIEFNTGNWAAVKAEAQAKHKVIFIDFYTDWCAPCKVMAQTIFPLKNVGDFYNKNFINVQINAEKGEGVALRKKYGIAGYPTMIFTNEKEEIIYRTMGSTSAEEFIDQGRLAMTAPSADLVELKSRYLKNELSTDELYKYYLRTKSISKPAETQEVFDKYFAKAANVSKEMFGTISSGVDSPDSKAFIYVLDHREGFGKVAGQDKVDHYIRTTLINSVEYNRYKTNDEYIRAKNMLKVKIDLSEKEELKIDGNYYCTVKDKERYMVSSSKLVNKYLQNDDFELSNVIGGSMRLDLNRDELLIVKSWAVRAVDIKDNALNNATLAMIYKLLKDKEHALKYINKSLDDCKRDNETYTSRVETFKKEIENAVY